MKCKKAFQGYWKVHEDTKWWNFVDSGLLQISSLQLLFKKLLITDLGTSHDVKEALKFSSELSKTLIPVKLQCG